jgi:hypothetical protein
MHGDLFIKFAQGDVGITVTTAAISLLGGAEVSIDANEEAVDKTPANRENTTDIQPHFVQPVWEPKRMEKLFVYLDGNFVNLNQIAWVGDATEKKPRSPVERQQNCRYRGAIRGRRAG